MTLKLVQTAAGFAGNPGSPLMALDSNSMVPDATLIVPANVYWTPRALHVKFVACAAVGTRAPYIVFTQAAVFAAISQFEVTVAASQTRYLESYKGLPDRSTYIHSDHAIAALPPGALLLPGNHISVGDQSQIANSGWAGAADASAATTLTQTGAGWTVDQWKGWSIHFGTARAVVTSNTNQVLTASGGWTPLVAGTAEASDATTMTDNDAAWTVDQWAGFVVHMGGSTATIISNTAHVLTFAAWSPPAPATGAYFITGPFTLIGDTVEVSLSYDQYEGRSA